MHGDELLRTKGWEIRKRRCPCTSPLLTDLRSPYFAWGGTKGNRSHARPMSRFM